VNMRLRAHALTTPCLVLPHDEPRDDYPKSGVSRSAEENDRSEHAYSA
jgi:hypothetical protein